MIKRLPGLVLLFASLLLPAAALALADISDLSPAEIQRYGTLMYRDGVHPDGEPIQAFVSGDIPVDGTAFTCVSCHLRSGLGSIEGEVVTPPTNGRILYQPREPFIPGAEFVPSYSNYAKYLPVRPAYTDESLALLIETGIDPTGRSVLEVMPRYELEGREMAIMIAYLKTLSDQPPPGVAKDQLKFATVIVEGTDPQKVESMLLPLQYSVDRKNSLAEAAKRNDRVARMGYNMLGDLTFVKFSLARWVLRGPPETWRVQLEDYYRQEPVYALLGGISEGEWEPVHRFCEEKQLPNLFPVVDYPVLAEDDWYTLYPSRGIRQEGEGAARYLKNIADLIGDRPVVQILRDNRRGRTLADGFQAVWTAAGHPPPPEVKLPGETPLTAELLTEVIGREQPAVLLVWDDASLLTPLSAISALEEGPQMVIASGTWLGEEMWRVPPELRKLVYLTWPYRLPREERRFDNAVRKVMAGKDPKNYDSVTLRQGFDAQELLSMALMEMRSEYYRDYLLDMFDMMDDLYLPLYERLSFGPGQRYASKGCFIVQVGPGDSPQLERRSEWVMP